MTSFILYEFISNFPIFCILPYPKKVYRGRGNASTYHFLNANWENFGCEKGRECSYCTNLRFEVL